MFRAKSWLVLGFLGISCVVPDVEVGDPTASDDDDNSSSGKSSTSAGGKSNSPSPNGGTGDVGEGGTDDPGPNTSGSTSRSGSGSGASPSGGSGPTPPAGSATGKFCNDVSVDGESITLTVRIGTGTKQVVMSVASGSCTPVSGLACKAIPTGTAVPVTLLAGSEAIVTYPVDIANGNAWIFVAYTDGTNVDLVGDPVTKAVCEEGYDAPTPPGGGA